MENTEQDIDFWSKFQKIRFDIGDANLDDVTDILNHYNQGPFVVQGVTYHYDINPLDAACLNARFLELTGKNHSLFMQEQAKVLDKMLESGEGVIVNGQPSIYQKLKNNLTGEGPGISILPRMKGSYIEKFANIKYDMSKASLADIKEILDYYDQESVLISGSQYHFRPNVLEGASLNARFKELTGNDHPVFARTQPQLLEAEIGQPQISVNGAPSIYELLRDNAIEIGSHNHVLNRFHDILNSLDTASLEDVSSLLNYFNGNPVLIDGVVHHSYNDPMTGSKLNTRYAQLTGKNHPVFAERAPKLIDSLLENKESLMRSGAYGGDYFNQLEQIDNSLNPNLQKSTDDGPELE